MEVQQLIGTKNVDIQGIWLSTTLEIFVTEWHIANLESPGADEPTLRLSTYTA